MRHGITPSTIIIFWWWTKGFPTVQHGWNKIYPMSQTGYSVVLVQAFKRSIPVAVVLFVVVAPWRCLVCHFVVVVMWLAFVPLTVPLDRQSCGSEEIL